jgi:hypothetical protein
MGDFDKRYTLHDILIRSATAALELQRDDGSFPPGKNGVYNDQETPVRTTSYWLTTLSKVYEISGNEEIADAANRAADYLLSEDVRPAGYTFHSRNVENKDKCDGLIGQAVPIWALACAGSSFDRSELVDLALEVYNLHPFDECLGLWEIVEIDGTQLSFDRTLNHQLLFAGAAAHLCHFSESVLHELTAFLDGLESNIGVRPDGTFKHYIDPPIWRIIRTATGAPRHWKLLPNALASELYTHLSTHRNKEIGYHPVNLWALGQISANIDKNNISAIIIDKSYFPELKFEESVERHNKYGSMTPGIDVATGLYHLQDAELERIRNLVELDIRKRYNFETGLLSNDAEDSILQAATVAHAVELPNVDLTL